MNARGTAAYLRPPGTNAHESVDKLTGNLVGLNSDRGRPDGA